MSRVEDVNGIFEEVVYGKSRRMAECTHYVEKVLDKEIKRQGEKAVSARLEHRWDRICLMMTRPDFYSEEAEGTYGTGYERLYREILKAVLGLNYSVENQIHIDPVYEEMSLKDSLGDLAADLSSFSEYIREKRISVSSIISKIRYFFSGERRIRKMEERERYEYFDWFDGGNVDDISGIVLRQEL